MNGSKPANSLRVISLSAWTNFMSHLEYRFTLFVWVLAAVVEPFIWSVIWYVAVRDGSGAMLSGSQVLYYYILLCLMIRINSPWTFEDLRVKILLGSFSKYLLYPSGIFRTRLGEELGMKLLNLVLILPVSVGWMIILSLWGIPGVALNLVVALPAVIVALSLQFVVDMLLIRLVLLTTRSDGLATGYHFLTRLLGGVVVPLALLPGWAQNIAALFPFRYVLSFPVECALGLVSGNDLVMGLGIGAGWVAIFGVLYWLISLPALKLNEYGYE